MLVAIPRVRDESIERFFSGSCGLCPQNWPENSFGLADIFLEHRLASPKIQHPKIIGPKAFTWSVRKTPTALPNSHEAAQVIDVNAAKVVESTRLHQPPADPRRSKTGRLRERGIILFSDIIRLYCIILQHIIWYNMLQ